VGAALGCGVGPRVPADRVWLGTLPDGDGLGAPAGVRLGAAAVGEGEGVGATGGVAFRVGVACCVGVAVGCVGLGVADGVAVRVAAGAGARCLGPD